MQPRTHSLERSLEDCINDAIQKAVKNPCGKDPFASALSTSIESFAFNLPTCLQQDGITTKETLPASRNVTITSVSSEDSSKKTSHPLVSAVDKGVIVLNQPIFYTVQKGDTLSDISWKLTGRKASVRDLKNWNTIWGDLIKPGQVLYLADPSDPFVKEVSTKLSKMELTGRNPKISLDRLSGEMIARHGGLFEGEFHVEIKLEYRESLKDFLNPQMFGRDRAQEIPWAPGYSGGWALENSFDRPFNSGEVDIQGMDRAQNGGACPTCLDPSTVGNWFYNYGGPNNPKSNNGEYNYSVSPKNLSDAQAYSHDLNYDEKRAVGGLDLVLNISVIDADIRFVQNQFYVAGAYLSQFRPTAVGFMYVPNIDPYTKQPIGIETASKALIQGVGLGIISLPKVIIWNIGTKGPF